MKGCTASWLFMHCCSLFPFPLTHTAMQVERILEAREWDAYGKMIEVLQHCLAQVTVARASGSACSTREHCCHGDPILWCKSCEGLVPGGA